MLLFMIRRKSPCQENADGLFPSPVLWIMNSHARTEGVARAQKGIQVLVANTGKNLKTGHRKRSERKSAPHRVSSGLETELLCPGPEV